MGELTVRDTCPPVNGVASVGPQPRCGSSELQPVDGVHRPLTLEDCAVASDE